MDKWLLSPPLVFLIVLIFSLLLSALFSRLAYRSKNKPAEGASKAYACGEDVQDHLAQPDYSQFFPFAFFFTLAHVATLMMTTVPAETAETLVLAVMYMSVVIVGLIALFRR